MFDDLFEWKSVVDNWVWLLGIPVAIFLIYRRWSNRYRRLRDSVSHGDSNVPKTGKRVNWSELWKRRKRK